MTDEQRTDDRPDVPDDVREPSTEATTGRPTGDLDSDGLRPGQSHERAPTVAPEERGAEPSTEHAPGGDL
jgi:hypothetical protein